MSHKYTIFADPGHAWIRVSLAEVVALGIVEKISSYSYIEGDDAWLEEDCDLTVFVHAKTGTAERAVCNAWFAAHVEEKHTNGEAYIRRLPSYSPAKVRAMGILPGVPA